MPNRRRRQTRRTTQRTAPGPGQRTLRVGGFTVSYDEQHALEAYRKIRVGSLIGATFTRTAFKLLQDQLGPDWRQQVFAEMGGVGEMAEEAENEELEAGEEGEADGRGAHH